MVLMRRIPDLNPDRDYNYFGFWIINSKYLEITVCKRDQYYPAIELWISTKNLYFLRFFFELRYGK